MGSFLFYTFGMLLTMEMIVKGKIEWEIHARKLSLNTMAFILTVCICIWPAFWAIGVTQHFKGGR